jgi:putative hydrolase of the HAD superfamily
MSKYKVLLLDVDGVLLLTPKFFSHVYAEEKGLDKERFDKFFADHANDAIKGKTDFRKLITEHNNVWEWDKSPDELLEKWFEYENFPNTELIEITSAAKRNGILVYLATDQDATRGKYLKEIMFKNLIDGAFISSELKHNKIRPEFFKLVLENLKNKVIDLDPAEIVFFDDIQHNIDSAIGVSISAFLYESPKQVKKILAE